MDSDPELSPEEAWLNATVLRVKATPQGRNEEGFARTPTISGRISVPVLNVYGIGDLQVPLSMGQIYARRVAQQGRSDLLVTRTIRSIPHCGFSMVEQVETWLALENWVEHGIRPDGDDILNPAVVADPRFGCKFTRVTRTAQGIPSCQ